MSAIGDAGIAFAQLRANRKIALDEDGKRWAEDVEKSLDAAEDVEIALVDALEPLLSHTAFYEHNYHPNGKRELVALRKAATAALRAAGRIS